MEDISRGRAMLFTLNTNEQHAAIAKFIQHDLESVHEKLALLH